MNQININTSDVNPKKAIGCGIRGALWGMVIIGGIVLGFIFLIRSCLSQWDSYGVIGWPGVTEDQKSMVIVKGYNKTTSYSSKNGMTHKSYSITYYLEKIDLATGKMVEKKKLMNHRKIKKGSMECFGGYKNKLWVFANFLRAYDMNTLEQVVKTEDIENKNPQLKGKMPIESQYYDPHVNMGYVTITAQDGDKYNIMLDDLHAELVNPDDETFDKFNKEFELQQKSIETKLDSLRGVYSHSNNYDKYSTELEKLMEVQDSLRNVKDYSQEIFNAKKDMKRMLEDFNPSSSDDLGDWVVMKDTAEGNAYVLEQKEPDDKNFQLYNFNSMGSETDKVNLYRMVLSFNPKANSSYDRYLVNKVELLGNERYLQGGMMRDYKTAKVLLLKNPSGFIIFSRDIIGNKGKLQVTRVDLNGKKIWQTDAQMSLDVNSAMATDNHLIITGIINQDKSPSFSVSDALRVFDLKTGALITVKY